MNERKGEAASESWRFKHNVSLARKITIRMMMMMMILMRCLNLQKLLSAAAAAAASHALDRLMRFAHILQY